ncbi:NAD-dependent epimerase/dehydratase family protein [Rhodococcus marinonascens]|uniref:NAD-dependent epimerase/dehydratase family protein n=1 Tax=Rhodococcus marinonascens TaxID=38311 RepID=UPI000A04B324|nr:NAD-dependent epimerase/dehydratase family protein [Rhodococcus marinonascens]
MTPSPGTALVVGATGISGQAISRQLVDAGWRTYGLSRQTSLQMIGVDAVRADLLDETALAQTLRGINPEVVFFTAWKRQNTERENIEVNSVMLRNTLRALAGGGSMRHVALSTGHKHYTGPLEDHHTGVMAETPFWHVPGE